MAHSQLQALFDSLTLIDREDIVRETGIAGFGSNVKVGLAPEPILAEILRRRKVSNAQYSDILGEIGVGAGPGANTTTVRLTFRHDRTEILATDLAAASVIVWEVSARVAGVLVALGVDPGELEPPVVLGVANGSTTLGLGGTSLLVAGVGFVIAALGNMAPSATGALMAGGTFLSSLGLIQLIMDWNKTIAETAKIDNETENIKEQKELTRLQQLQAQRDLAAPIAAPSAALPPSVTLSLARENGITVTFGNQLLNEALPAANNLVLAAGSPAIVVTPTQAAVQGVATAGA